MCTENINFMQSENVKIIVLIILLIFICLKNDIVNYVQLILGESTGISTTAHIFWCNSLHVVN